MELSCYLSQRTSAKRSELHPRETEESAYCYFDPEMHPLPQRNQNFINHYGRNICQDIGSALHANVLWKKIESF